ncbi:MAG: fluoride efflux transporter CrcB [Candidatus Goldiibacteriota bacterium]|jgi:CrcB protein
MFNFILVIIGGAIGSVARFSLSTWVNQVMQTKSIFPYGTLAVNMIGSFLAGVVWGISTETTMKPETRIFLLVGFMGGFTTFSAYALESFNLFDNGEVKAAFMNILANNVFSLILVFAGVLTAKYIIKGLKGGI